ncbi:MAG TPA: hypothetical protein VFU90_08570, partial [Candidatus Tumulicola sp.]|nr:hypothetical protein [Candidatus Tumulicola sp.]
MQPTTARSLMRRCAAAGGLALCLLAGLLGILSSPASAFKTRPLLGKFGALSNPHGIAIDQSTGDLYVADTANNRIEKFDETGKFLLAFGANVGGAGVNTCTSGCAAGTSGSAPGQFTTATFVAVDNSASASKGDVYVGDVGDNKVSKFTSSGELVSSWGTGGQLDGSTTGFKTFAPLAGVAVDSSGNLFVLKGQTEPGRLFKFTQSGSFVTEEFGHSFLRLNATLGLALDATGNIFKVNGDGSVDKLKSNLQEIGTVTPQKPAAKTRALDVDPATGDLFLPTSAGTLDHYAFNASDQVIEPNGPPCPLVEAVGCTPSDSASIGFVGAGIAVNAASEDTYVSNPTTGQVFEYGPLVTVPDVTTEAATNVVSTAARFNGKVNPDELAVTTCEFEYVSDAQLVELNGKDYEERIESGSSPAEIFEAVGSHAACEHPDAAEIGAGASNVAVHADVTGLTSGARYHFRLVAANANGPNAGSVLSFVTVTPPTIEGAEARDLTPTTANLEAEINPGSGETTYHIEYGTSTSYGTVVPVPDGDVGSGASDVPVAQHVAGLISGVAYHWRVVASNSAGTTIGADHVFIFKTIAATLPDGRAYEMVTPPQKNGSLIGDTGGLGLQPSIAAGGGRLIATSLQCFAGAQSCNAQHGVGIGSPYSFERTSTAWITTPLAPPATGESPANTPWIYLADNGSALFSMPTPPFGVDSLFKREAGGGFVAIGPISPSELGPQTPVAGKPGAFVQAQTADLSHIAWSSGSGPLHWPFDATEVKHSSIYEYTGTGNARPFLVGVTGGA